MVTGVSSVKCTALKGKLIMYRCARMCTLFITVWTHKCQKELVFMSHYMTEMASFDMISNLCTDILDTDCIVIKCDALYTLVPHLINM